MSRPEERTAARVVAVGIGFLVCFSVLSPVAAKPKKSIAVRLLDTVNAARATAGSPPLELEPQLTALARKASKSSGHKGKQPKAETFEDEEFSYSIAVASAPTTGRITKKLLGSETLLAPEWEDVGVGTTKSKSSQLTATVVVRKPKGGGQGPASEPAPQPT